MSGRAFWGIFGGGNEQHPRFSLPELQRLHSVVLRNQVVTDANRDVVVEALRSISELVIWCGRDRLGQPHPCRSCRAARGGPGGATQPGRTLPPSAHLIAAWLCRGDQHESENSIVEYFLTQNMLGHFTRILLQRSNRRGNVAMQVLQTLSILVQVRGGQQVHATA